MPKIKDSPSQGEGGGGRGQTQQPISNPPPLNQLLEQALYKMLGAENNNKYQQHICIQNINGLTLKRQGRGPKNGPLEIFR